MAPRSSASRRRGGLAALEARRIDAYVGDRVCFIGLLGAARNPSELIVGNRLLTREPYGIADSGRSRSAAPGRSRPVPFYATREFTAPLVKYFGEQAPAIQAQILAQSASE